MPISSSRKAREMQEAKLAALSAKPFAHRGLHSENGPVENSVAAFEAAIDAGFGIELDVQLTQEAGAVVFHDSTLERLSEGTGPVMHKSMRALESIRLRNSDETIRTLQDVLLHIGGRTPVLIEAKVGRASPLALALAVRRSLEGYLGPVGIMSFHPAVSRWFHDHFPMMLNGLVVSKHPDAIPSAWHRNKLARAIAIERAKPKFIAYDVRSLPSMTVRSFRTAGKRAFTWTVRDEHDLETGRAHADQVIVEGEAARRLAGKPAPATAPGPTPTAT